MAGHLPGFVLGFLALAVLRAVGDRLLGPLPVWRTALAIDRQFVMLATVTVSAGIGLHLEVKGLLSAGARAVVLGAGASATMSGLTLALVTLAGRGMRTALLSTSIAAMAGSFALWQLTRRAHRLLSTAGVPRRRRTTTASAAIVVDALDALTASGAHRRAAATNATGEHRLP